ncbi:MAG: DUF1573 domain-containing protein, partial [Sedimentisphaerales bacterium]|nr:DUF1573 domain-containing protein [Sedimentisphaerales bacterium]
PVISVDRDLFELGELSTNSNAPAQFAITNRGNALLEITNIGKCCGASVELSSSKLEPGQSATLKVVYFTGDEPGAFRKDLFIYSNDPARPTVRLTIAGNIKQYLVWEPTHLVLFLNKPNLGCPDIKIKALDGKAFAVIGQISAGDCITVDYDPNLQTTELVLKPKVHKDKLLALEYPRGTFQLRLTRPDYPTLGLPFDLVPNYTVNPTQIYLAGTEPGKPLVKRIQVLDNYVDFNVGDANFVIQSVKSAKGISRVASTKKVKSGYELEIEVTPPALEPGRTAFSDDLTIAIKDSDEQLMVLVQGFYASKLLMNRRLE